VEQRQVPYVFTVLDALCYKVAGTELHRFLWLQYIGFQNRHVS
jgi:hypothetical protein